MLKWVPRWWLVVATLVAVAFIVLAIVSTHAEPWRRLVFASPALAMVIATVIIGYSRRSQDPSSH